MRHALYIYGIAHTYSHLLSPTDHHTTIHITVSKTNMSVHTGKTDSAVFTMPDRYQRDQKSRPVEEGVNGTTMQRVALVTGAGQGIGRAIAVRLARDGFDVAVSDIPSNRERLQQTADAIRIEASRRICAVYADVSKEDEVEAMVHKVVDELGGLDVMVANAGMAILEEFSECKHPTLSRLGIPPQVLTCIR